MTIGVITQKVFHEEAGVYTPINLEFGSILSTVRPPVMPTSLEVCLVSICQHSTKIEHRSSTHEKLLDRYSYVFAGVFGKR